MKNVFRILRYVLNYKRYVILNVFCNSLYVFFSLFSFVLIIPFISVLFGIVQAPPVCPEPSMDKDVLIDYFSWQLNDYKESHGIYSCLLYIGGIYMVFVFFSSLFRYLGTFFLTPIRNGVVQDIRDDLYRKITILPVSFFSDKRKGDIISRLTSDLGDVEWSITTSLQMFVKDPVMVIVFFIALIIASWQLVVFILIVLPLAYLLIRWVGNSLNANSVEGQKEMGTMLSCAEETLDGLRLVKSYNAEDIMSDRFKRNNDRYTGLMIKIFRKRELASPLTEFLAITALVSIVLFGGEMVLTGKLQPAVLIGFTLIFARIISPLQSVVTAYYNLQKANAAAVRLYEILDADEKILEEKNAVTLSGIKYGIEFKDVSFSYNANEKPVLQNINLCIKKGQTVALVGASGAGKSTLVDLVSRFADCTSGEILFDGVNIKKFNINSLRQKIGLVTQESILFNDTIFKNIAFGNKDATMEQVVQAAKIANAHDFISRLEKGYFTHLTDRGLSLSGGERQRICIARAVLKNPEILVLDEATSALDTKNEYLVQQALTHLMQGRTSIIIAHRLSTVTQADLIVVLNQGQLVEKGTHTELVEKGGLYCQLVKMQNL
ncbi:MAG TPA: ABC transporter ATP-binding protein/permease [Candidatus Onthomorpha intestinigallinarum]|uniref:ABC transporter ATP-binding protein/permease n=1 Tax=Candidatus Onthomorpha intestinigallinarum TaxID=2840880 RepID=A0A9D1RIH0_9BACT|nr:ABC transporter ATP-binding protein/permease [Candidatus Onthomorpha intestinigallinarum]